MHTVSRLIDQFIPQHYQLSLDLDRPNRTFKGVVTINGTSPADTESIIVHSKDLAIESATLDGKAADFGASESDELHITHPDISAGDHVLVIAFSGTITDAMHGLYPCYYEHDGAKKELLATQFESHHAREAFPCIDEPEAKSTFDVTLATEQDITVLGNMPVKRQAVEDERLVTAFDTTPRMSTYLLAWVTGELHRKTATTKQGVEVNIWATPAQPVENLDFALEHAVKTIGFFDEYFGVAYPLPKSDHIALPDFSSGAMENWGLITYREVALLANPKTTSISDKQYIAMVVAHELSHQWFGNLVTMKWWNNLWLNESFATLMEYVAVDALRPEWQVWQDFSSTENIMALRRDSIDGVQSVQTDVHHPDEITALFDGAIVYAKGARLLRMLRQYIGQDAFQQGLRAYFTKHAYGNTDGDDLWQAFASASGKDISAFMNIWISQSGFPVVKVSKEGDNVHLHQQQFFVGPHATSDRLWPVPLNASGLPAMLETSDLVVPYAGSTPPRLNVGDTAHFLTQYDTEILAELISKIESFTPLDRLQLLHEQTLLARGGVATTASLVPLLDAYKNETNESVWGIISLATNELKKFVEADEQSEKKLRDLARNLAYAQYQRLGWKMVDGEPETDTKLRATVVGMVLYGEDSEAIQTAVQIYQTNSLEQLDPELRSLIIGANVRHSDDDSTFPALVELYKTTSSVDLKQDIAAGLSSTRDINKINELLGYVMDESTVRPQDVVRWFAYLIQSRHGRQPTWQWLQDNWAWVAEMFGGDKSYDAFPRYAAGGLVTRQQLDEYRAFFTPMQNEPALTRVITMGISEIEGRVELIERDSTAVQEALAKL